MIHVEFCLKATVVILVHVITVCVLRMEKSFLSVTFHSHLPVKRKEREI